jgi:nucleoside-diphosphate-sugar epimerase
VRDKNRADKIDPLKKAFGEKFDQLELVEADLCKEETIINACEGCQYVVHTASPFPLDKPKNEMELITPAVEGTLAAMKGCKKYGVKRIVITSSIVSLFKPTDTKKLHLTRADWTDVKRKDVAPYEKSKTLAEQAAWDFQKELPENEKFEIVVINPGFVLGPNLNKANFTSGDIIKKLVTGEIPRTPEISFGTVDVRDVA